MKYLTLISFFCCISRNICFQFVDEVNLKKCGLIVNEIADGPCFCETKKTFTCSCNSIGIKYTTSAPSALIFSEKREKAFKWPPSEPYDARIWHPLLGTLSGKEEPLKHLKKYPQKVSDIHTKFYLFYDLSVRKKVDYNKKETLTGLPQFKQLYLIIHGYFGSFESFLHMKDNLLDQNINSAVVLVDWSISSQALYSTAAANTVIVGREVALLLYLLVKETRIQAEHVHVVGHNLGAHVAHFAGQWFVQLMVTDEMKKGKTQCINLPAIRLHRITGLDPSSTDFEGYRGSHISKQDAIFVDIIHTSSVSKNGSLTDILLGFTGISQAVGDIDFYPNGGKSQPGCRSFIGSDVYNGLCSESKAVEYFEKSLIQRNRHLFTSFPCNAWSGFNECKRKTENPRHLSRMGIDASHFCGRGHHFLKYMPEESVTGGKLHLPFDVNRRAVNWPETGVSVQSKGFSTVLFSLNEYIYNFVNKCIGYVPPIEPSPPPPAEDIVIYPDSIEEPPKVAVFPGTRRKAIMFNHPSCGLSKAPATGRIVNGNFPYLGQFPWTVYIIHHDLMEQTEGFCTGSIINKYWLLTAAHCIPDITEWNYTPLRIFYGRVNKNSKEGRVLRQTHQKGYTFRHPLFKGCTNTDIALVKLKGRGFEGVPIGRETYRGGHINRICLKSVDIAGIGFKRALTISGIGLSDNTTFDGLMRYNEFKLFPESVCRIFRGWDAGYQTNFCYSGIGQRTTSCQGDSGAPVAVKRSVEGANHRNNNGFRFHQIAVNTGGDDVSCGDIEQDNQDNKIYPVFDYGAKIKEAYDWIYETIKDNSEDVKFDM